VQSKRIPVAELLVHMQFRFFFTYLLTGWDGSAADATLWNDAHSHDLRMPPHRYLLADAGFGTYDALLVPY
jgi:hypothetical protein